jgi:hypothetical protein
VENLRARRSARLAAGGTAGRPSPAENEPARYRLRTTTRQESSTSRRSSNRRRSVSSPSHRSPGRGGVEIANEICVSLSLARLLTSWPDESFVGQDGGSAVVAFPALGAPASRTPAVATTSSCSRSTTFHQRREDPSARASFSRIAPARGLRSSNWGRVARGASRVAGGFAMEPAWYGPSPVWRIFWAASALWRFHDPPSSVDFREAEPDWQPATLEYHLVKRETARTSPTQRPVGHPDHGLLPPHSGSLIVTGTLLQSQPHLRHELYNPIDQREPDTIPPLWLCSRDRRFGKRFRGIHPIPMSIRCAHLAA